MKPKDAPRRPVILPPRSLTVKEAPAAVELANKEPVANVSAAIIITCGPGCDRWVRDALTSALEQEGNPEVVCVFDRCPRIDGIDSRVKVLSVEYGAVQQSRRAGVAASIGEVICFLDADNAYTGMRFVADAVSQLRVATAADSRVAGLTCDIEYYDEAWHPRNHRLTTPDVWDRERFDRGNYVDVCAPVWRYALESSWQATSPNGSHEDYRMWRELVDAGWVFHKGQGLTLKYRFCPGSSSSAEGQGEYADRCGLYEHPVTLFVPLSGRVWAWQGMKDWLTDLAASPRGQSVRLVLCDTSMSAEFSAMIRRDVIGIGFWDCRYYQQSVHTAGLADADRAKHERVVQLICSAIYNRFAQECSTSLALILEDDILPHLSGEETLRRMIGGLTDRTIGVAGVYYDRREGCVNSWVSSVPGRVYRITQKELDAHDGDYLPINGTGFGCLLIRRESLRAVPHALPTGELWYDPRFFRRACTDGRVLLLARHVTCAHRERPKPGGVPVLEHDWFTHHSAPWHAPMRRFVKTPVQILEIGSFEGRSALWFAEHLMEHPGSRLLCIDAGIGVGSVEQLQRLRANLDTSPRRSQIELRIGSSFEILPTLTRGEYDVIYVDGSHLGGDTIRDLCNAWDLMAPGGVMVVDDYEFKEAGVEPREWVRPAVDYWLSLRAPEIEILHKGYQVIVRRVGTRLEKSRSTQHCLGHLYPVKANNLWQWHVQQLHARLPLFNGRVLVSVAIDESTVSRQEVAAMFADHPSVEVRYVANDPSTGERQSFLWGLQELQQAQDDPSASLFYWHSKAVTIKPGDTRHHYDAVRRWAESMWRVNVDTWPLANEQMKITPVTGAHCTRWPGTDSLHYSGAFLWVMLAALKGKPWMQMDPDRWAVEKWPGQIFKPDQMGCLFNDRRHEAQARCLYLDSTWKRLAEPMKVFLGTYKGSRAGCATCES